MSFKEKTKGLLADFKAFAMKGNVIDMAIGVIIGTAFGKIVTSIVNDLIMPLIGIIGGKDFSEMSWTINGSAIKYGAFIQNVIDFLIIAICMFIVVKLITTLSNLKKKKEEPKEEEPEPEPEKSDEVKLLEEIRDLLKK